MEEAGDRVPASKTGQVWRTEGGSGAPDGCPGWRGAVTARKTERGWLGGLHREEGTLCEWMLDATLCGLELPEYFRERRVGPWLLLETSPWQHVGEGVGEGGIVEVNLPLGRVQSRLRAVGIEVGLRAQERGSICETSDQLLPAGREEPGRT